MEVWCSGLCRSLLVPHVLPVSNLAGTQKSQHSAPAPGLCSVLCFFLVNNSVLCS